MKSIRILDTTLRDGEQAAGVTLDPDQKLTIARRLEELGVDVIEAGFPASNQDDFEAAKEIAKQINRSKICVFGRMTHGDIDKAYEAAKYSENSRIHVFIATSQIHRDKKLRKSASQVLEMIGEGVAYAKAKFNTVQFSPEDASRTEEKYLMQTIETAIDAGASIINVTDTVGYSDPFRFYERVKKIRERFAGVELSVHCHNDLGNAVANTMAGILAGATQVECTINGIGERTGNAALEEVVMNIETHKEYYGVSTKIDTTKLYDISCLVSELTGLYLPVNKPVVGANAFSHESGIHQHGVIADPSTYEVMIPEKVGWKGRRFVNGKHSGRHKELVGVENGA